MNLWMCINLPYHTQVVPQMGEKRDDEEDNSGPASVNVGATPANW